MMKAKALRALLCGLVALMLWPGFTQGAEKQSETEKMAQPDIHVDMPTYDFNQVPQGEVVKHDFRVLNQGNAPLEIKNVKPG
jgi:hypothetical protein